MVLLRISRARPPLGWQYFPREAGKQILGIQLHGPGDLAKFQHIDTALAPFDMRDHRLWPRKPLSQLDLSQSPFLADRGQKVGQTLSQRVGYIFIQLLQGLS